MSGQVQREAVEEVVKTLGMVGTGMEATLEMAEMVELEAPVVNSLLQAAAPLNLSI